MGGKRGVVGGWGLGLENPAKFRTSSGAARGDRRWEESCFSH